MDPSGTVKCSIDVKDGSCARMPRLIHQNCAIRRHRHLPHQKITNHSKCSYTYIPLRPFKTNSPAFSHFLHPLYCNPLRQREDTGRRYPCTHRHTHTDTHTHSHDSLLSCSPSLQGLMQNASRRTQDARSWGGGACLTLVHDTSFDRHVQDVAYIVLLWDRVSCIHSPWGLHAQSSQSSKREAAQIGDPWEGDLLSGQPVHTWCCIYDMT